MNKIDGKLLKKLIKEMIEKMDEENLDECGMSEDGYEPEIQDQESPQEPVEASSYEIDPDGYEGYMAKGNLYKMAKSATELHNLLEDNENLEPWVEEKIAVAARMIDDVADYMEYAKMAKK